MTYAPPAAGVALQFAGGYVPPEPPVALDFTVEQSGGGGETGLPAAQMGHAYRLPFGAMPYRRTSIQQRWQVTRYLRADHSADFAELKTLRTPLSVDWRSEGYARSAGTLMWDRLLQRQRELNTLWLNLEVAQAALNLSWREMWARQRATDALWYGQVSTQSDNALHWQPAKPVTRAFSADMEFTLTERLPQVIAWGPVDTAPVCWMRYVPPPAGSEIKAEARRTDLSFDRTSPEYALICDDGEHSGGTGSAYPGSPPSWYPEPVKRFYMLIHSLQCVRLPDRTPIPVLAGNISLSRGDVFWSLSATLPDQSTLALIQPSAANEYEIELTLNGFAWVFVVTAVTRERSNGLVRYRIEGESRTKRLMAPDQPERTGSINQLLSARQIAEQALNFTGFTLDWQTVDWPVPANTFSYQNQSPIQVVQQVAGGVDAWLLPDPVTPTITAVPRYPLSPWKWADEDADSLAESLISVDSLASKPGRQYNAVTVYGGSNGVLVNVKRAGSAGDLMLGDIQDNLITDVTAGQERGRNALGRTGRWAEYQTTLQQAPGVPRYLPGDLITTAIDGVTVKGQISAVGWQFGREGPLKIKQSLTLEVYEDD